jgi:hypothetical protein
MERRHAESVDRSVALLSDRSLGWRLACRLPAVVAEQLSRNATGVPAYRKSRFLAVHGQRLTVSLSDPVLYDVLDDGISLWFKEDNGLAATGSAEMAREHLVRDLSNIHVEGSHTKLDEI